MRRADGGRSDGARTWPWDEDHWTDGRSVVGDEVLGSRGRCQKHRRVTSTTPSCRSRSSCASVRRSLHPRPPASTDVPCSSHSLPALNVASLLCAPLDFLLCLDGRLRLLHLLSWPLPTLHASPNHPRLSPPPREKKLPRTGGGGSTRSDTVSTDPAGGLGPISAFPRGLLARTRRQGVRLCMGKKEASRGARGLRRIWRGFGRAKEPICRT